MNTQLNSHAVQETATVPFAPPILPVVIEQTARHVFESFSEKMKAALNGREDRALKLAVDGHVTYKFARTFSVRSEDNQHAYLVNLEKSFCTCPDSQKGHVCKHRLAAYLVEQSMKASQQLTAQPSVPEQPVPSESAPTPDPHLSAQEEAIEKVRQTLHARSEYMRESTIYALLPLEKDDMLPVEIIDLEGDIALVRALPYEMNGKPVPRFPFPERKSFAQVLAKSLVEVKIYR
jgi:hypothetical protein